MINYNEVARLATSGINFFRGGSGEFDCVTSASGTKMVNGEEVYEPKQTVAVKGFVRDPKFREIDGEAILANDKLGCFDNSQKIEKGFQIVIDGEAYVVTDPRPIRQTNVTVCYRPILRRVAAYG